MAKEIYNNAFENESRKGAHSCARMGVAAFAQAFNHFDEGHHPYRYAPEVQERFLDIARELYSLVERGRIECNPNHEQFLIAQEATQNKTLQALYRRASRKTPIKAYKPVR